MAVRFDLAVSVPRSRVTTTPIGGLRIDANPTRVGVLPYRYSDGSVKREYRPAEEVFHADSLASMRGAAVTIGHPKDLVTPENFRALNVGGVGDDVRADGDLMAASVAVNDATALAGVNSRDTIELSAGYTCDTDETPGVTPRGEPYDAIQRNIRYNHVALLPAGAGRAGPDCRLRLDAASAIRVSMLKIRIDGIEYDAGSASAQEAHDDLVKRLKDKVTDADKAVNASLLALGEEKTRADTAELAASPKALAARVAFRSGLIAKARATKLGPTYMADEAEAAATDDDSIIKAVIGQLAPEMDLNGLDHAGLMIALKLVSSMKAAPAADAPPGPAAVDSIAAAGTPGAALDGAAIVRPLPTNVEPVDAHKTHAAALAKRADAWKNSLAPRKAG